MSKKIVRFSWICKIPTFFLINFTITTLLYLSAVLDVCVYVFSYIISSIYWHFAALCVFAAQHSPHEFYWWRKRSTSCFKLPSCTAAFVVEFPSSSLGDNFLNRGKRLPTSIFGRGVENITGNIVVSMNRLKTAIFISLVRINSCILCLSSHAKLC